MFEKNDKVNVVKPLYPGYPQSFIGKSGKVTGFDGKWVLVSLEDVSDPTPVGFRAHELEKAN